MGCEVSMLDKLKNQDKVQNDDILNINANIQVGPVCTPETLEDDRVLRYERI